MSRVRLTPAQAAAIECRMHGSEQIDGLTVLDGYLVVEDGTLEAVADASNAEDAFAEDPRHNAECRKLARRAAKCLSNLHLKVAGAIG